MGIVSLSASDIGWGAVEFKVPPEGFITVRPYWRLKLSLKVDAMLVEGADSHPAYQGRSRRLADDLTRAVMGQQEETERQAGTAMGAAAQAELDSNRLQDMSEAIAQGRGLNGALSKLVDGWGANLSGSDEIAEATAGICWDEDYCIFEIGCSFTRPHDPNVDLDGLHLKLKLETKVKIGLTPEGWARLLAIVAARVPQAARFAEVLNAFFQPLRVRLAAILARLGITASPRLAGLLGFIGSQANIWMWAITIGFAVRDLSVWICRKSWEAGVRRGLAMSYSVAFVRTIFGYDPVFQRYTPHVLRVQQRAESHATALIHRGNQIPTQAWILSSFGGTTTSVNSHGDAQTLGERMGLDMGASGLSDVRYLEELRRFLEAYNGAA